ncbi:MAG: hypothetical protein ABIO62_12125 [Paracoccaceae bacterium]
MTLGKMRFLAIMLMLALPAQAQECFSGKPKHVAYSDGHAITIIQRYGDDLTYTMPYAGDHDAVLESQMMLFPKHERFAGRSVEHKWPGRLPKSSALKPGYHFDLNGTMKSGSGAAVPYRNEGDVLRQEVVSVGACSYDVVVIAMNTYINNELAITATNYLSLDMLVLLRSDFVPISASSGASWTAVAIE